MFHSAPALLPHRSGAGRLSCVRDGSRDRFDRGWHSGSMSETEGPTKAPEVYADAFTIAWTPFGVDLAFGRNYEEGVGLNMPRVVVVMSPQLADALAAELALIASLRTTDAAGTPAKPPGLGDVGDLS